MRRAPPGARTRRSRPAASTSAGRRCRCLAHRAVDHAPEVGGDPVRVGDDVDRAEQRRGDPAQLADHPVGADTAAVALELPSHVGQRGVELLRRLVLVLAVGEQDRVADATGRGGEQLAGSASATGRSRCHRLASAARAAFLAASRVDAEAGTSFPRRDRRASRVVGARDHTEQHAVADAVDRHAGGLARGSDLARGESIDPETSTITISAASDCCAYPAAASEVTVTIALTSVPPAGDTRSGRSRP